MAATAAASSTAAEPATAAQGRVSATSAARVGARAAVKTIAVVGLLTADATATANIHLRCKAGQALAAAPVRAVLFVAAAVRVRSVRLMVC